MLMSHMTAIDYMRVTPWEARICGWSEEDISGFFSPYICGDGTKVYMKNDQKIHREEGLPAVIYTDGREEFWNDGEFMKIHTQRDPQKDDDVIRRFKIGNHWLNTTSQELFECIDATSGHAQWIKVE